MSNIGFHARNRLQRRSNLDSALMVKRTVLFMYITSCVNFLVTGNCFYHVPFSDILGNYSAVKVSPSAELALIYSLIYA